MNRNFTALLLIIIAVGVYFTITRGMIADAQAVKTVNDQYTVALGNATNLVNILGQVDKQWTDISAADRDRLDKMIPSSVDNIRLIIDLNNVAVNHGFTLSNVKAAESSASSDSTAPVGLAGRANMSTSVGTPTLDTVNVTFSATAPYDQFILFLQDIEASLRVMDVTHLSIAVSDAGVYTYDVQLQTYWVRQ